MDGHQSQATIQRIDYGSTFRFTRLFDGFRIAIHPSRLMLALLLIVLLYIGGRVMDWIWGDRVHPQEFQQYVQVPGDRFDRWLESRPAGIDGSDNRENYLGVFEATLAHTLRLFDGVVNSTLQLRLGVEQVAPGTQPRADSVLGSLRMLLLLPAWLWTAHPGFFAVYLTILVLLWSLFGGAISRQTVADAAQARLIPAHEAIHFAWRRWHWYLLAPLLPPAGIGLLAFILALGGLVLFNWPVLNILGALLFIVALGLGFVMALLLVGWLAGVHLMYPAIGAEDTDGFDALSRAFSYVLARPWRLLLYTLIALLYGAATYLFVGLILFLVIWLTQSAASAWLFFDDAPESFARILPPPRFGELSQMPDLDGLGVTYVIAGLILRAWVGLLIGLLGAYVISYYISAYSVIYLLLRQQTDGTDPSELHLEEPDTPPVHDKVEPASAPADTAEPGESPSQAAEGQQEQRAGTNRPDSSTSNEDRSS